MRTCTLLCMYVCMYACDGSEILIFMLIVASHRHVTGTHRRNSEDLFASSPPIDSFIHVVYIYVSMCV